ncbi:hypothetical protein F5X68DRAFT_277233 [Plectosphaerella plurivora]|uniref:Uncharacterized protein n=1 Tax=Plectosphaerella plurivora TaxID=936078 RepID=A0A9P8V8I7_9PEZI|nr:hypothetical protein F5X68DRAFT_277233 [Plectosphaerella plurivora]
MQIKALLVGAFAALAIAAPGDWRQCHGDMEWDDVQKLCKCDKGEYYDSAIQRCRIKEVKEIKTKKCFGGEKLFCVRSEGEYVEYNKKSPYCWDDNHSKVICAKKNSVTSKFQLEIKKHYETTTSSSATEVEEKRHSCGKPRFYNYETTDCECPRNKHWDGKTCGFPALKKPVCETGHAYCAKSSHQIVKYSKENHLCKDNGKNYVFCCEASSAAQSCLKKTYQPLM